MRLVVTGGAGFIGSEVVRQAANRGDSVVVLDSMRADVHRHREQVPLPSGVRLVAGDVRDGPVVAEALRGADIVVHLAGKVGLGVDIDDMADYVGSNDLGTAVLLQQMAAAGLDRLVLASSMVVYGEGRYRCPQHGVVAPRPREVDDLSAGRFEPRCDGCGEPLSADLVAEDAPLDPRTTYAATKVAQEHLAAVWARETNGAATALRFHNVYGPGLPRDTPYAGVAALFLSASLAGRAAQVFEDGGQRRDFVHVSDVAGAVLAAADARVPGREGRLHAYNVGSGTVTTVGRMAELLAGAVGGPAPVVTGRYRLGDVRHITASSQRLADELGWRARVSIAEGLGDLVSHARRHRPVTPAPGETAAPAPQSEIASST